MRHIQKDGNLCWNDSVKGEMGNKRGIQAAQAFVSRVGSHGFYKVGNFLTS
jgi:hypothetical protein